MSQPIVLNPLGSMTLSNSRGQYLMTTQDQGLASKIHTFMQSSLFAQLYHNQTGGNATQDLAFQRISVRISPVNMIIQTAGGQKVLLKVPKHVNLVNDSLATIEHKLQTSHDPYRQVRSEHFLSTIQMANRIYQTSAPLSTSAPYTSFAQPTSDTLPAFPSRQEAKSKVEQDVEALQREMQTMKLLHLEMKEDLDHLRNMNQELVALCKLLAGQSRQPDDEVVKKPMVAQQQFEDQIRRNEELQKKLAKKDERLKAARQTAFEVIDENLEIQRDSSKLKRENQELTEQIRLLKQEREELALLLQQGLQSVGVKVESQDPKTLAQKLILTAQAFQKEIALLRTQIEENTAQIGENDKEIKALQFQAKKDAERNDELEEQIEDLTLDISQLKGKNARLDLKAKDLEREASRLGEQLDAARSQRDQAREKNRKLELENSQLQRDLDKASRELKEAGQHLDEAREELKQLPELKKQLQQVKALASAINELYDDEVRDNKHLRDELRDTKEVVQQKEKQHEHLKQQLDSERVASDQQRQRAKELDRQKRILEEKVRQLEEKAKQIPKLEKKAEGLQERVDEFKEQNRKLIEEKDQLERKVQHATQDIQRLEGEVEVAEHKAQLELRSHRSTQEKLQEAQLKARTLEQQVRELQTNQQRDQRQIDQLRRANKKLDDQNEDLQDQITDLEKQAKRIPELERTVREQKQQLELTKAQVELLTEQAQQVEEQKRVLVRQQRELEKQLQTAKQEKSQLERRVQELPALQKQLEKAEEKATELQRQVEQAERTLQKTEQQKRDLEQAKREQEVRIVGLQTLVEGHEDTIHRLQNTSKQRLAQLEEKSLKASALEKELKDAQSDIRKMKERLKELEDVEVCLEVDEERIESKDRRIKELHQDNLDLYQQTLDQESEIKQLQRKIEELQKLEGAIRLQQKKIDEQDRQMNQLRRELTRAQQGKASVERELERVESKNEELESAVLQKEQLGTNLRHAQQDLKRAERKLEEAERSLRELQTKHDDAIADHKEDIKQLEQQAVQAIEQQRVFLDYYKEEKKRLEKVEEKLKAKLELAQLDAPKVEKLKVERRQLNEQFLENSEQVRKLESKIREMQKVALEQNVELNSLRRQLQSEREKKKVSFSLPASPSTLPTTAPLPKKPEINELVQEAISSLDLQKAFEEHDTKLIEKLAEIVIVIYSKKMVASNPALAEEFKKVRSHYLFGLALLEDSEEIEMLIAARLMRSEKAEDLSDSLIYKIILGYAQDSFEQRAKRETTMNANTPTEEILEEYLDDMEDEFVAITSDKKTIGQFFIKLNRDEDDVLFHAIDTTLAQAETKKESQLEDNKREEFLERLKQMKERIETTYDQFAKLHHITGSSKKEIDRDSEDLGEELLEELKQYIEPLVKLYAQNISLSEAYINPDEKDDEDNDNVDVKTNPFNALRRNDSIFDTLCFIKYEYDSFLDDPLSEKALEAAFNIHHASLMLFQYYDQQYGSKVI